ncbi:MAG: hypothetical protein ABSG46_03375 [Candidatus Binataceae bacterium]
MRYFLLAIALVLPLRASAATPEYLLFNVFIGNIASNGTYSQTLTPSQINTFAENVVSTVQVSPPVANRILGIDVGPISMDQGAAGAVASIDEAFSIALAHNLAVSIHLDDRMFWINAAFPDGASLLATPGTAEWTDWNGNPAPPLSIGWISATNLAPQMCYDSPAVQAWTQYWLSGVIGPAIEAGYQNLVNAGKPQLFAGVFSGWESNIVYGYCSLRNLGYSASAPPANFDTAVETVLQAHISLWSQYLSEAGIPTSKIYTHEAWPTLEPFAAFNSYSQTGWTNYNWPDSFDEIYSTVGSNRWVQAEGSNVVLSDSCVGACPSPYSWENYLAASYNHGASLVNIFGAFQDQPGAFALAQGPQAVAAYKQFLQGAALIESSPIP